MLLLLLSLLLCLLMLLLPLHTCGPSSLLHHIPQCTFQSSSCLVMLAVCHACRGLQSSCSSALGPSGPQPLTGTSSSSSKSSTILLYLHSAAAVSPSAQGTHASMFQKTWYTCIVHLHCIRAQHENQDFAFLCDDQFTKTKVTVI
jgi:hypothetical protein